MIDYKNKMLELETPVCILERMACDLTGSAEREQLFDQHGKETSKAMILTEGVIGYLSNAQGEELAVSLSGLTPLPIRLSITVRAKCGRAGSQKKLKKILKALPGF